MSESDTRTGLFARLAGLTKRWDEYEDIPESQQLECRDIGVKLHALGGKPLMTDGYYHAKSKNRCASVVAAYWDGIGDWQW